MIDRFELVSNSGCGSLEVGCIEGIQVSEAFEVSGSLDSGQLP